MNKRRKEKLIERSIAYGKRKHHDQGLWMVGAAADGFEDGYRAAMRDLRRISADAIKEHGTDTPAILEFLRPLR